MYIVTFRDIVVIKVSLNLWINFEYFILFLTYIRHNNVCYVPIKLIIILYTNYNKVYTLVIIIIII